MYVSEHSKDQNSTEKRKIRLNLKLVSELIQKYREKVAQTILDNKYF